MNAFSRGLSAAIRARHASVICSAVTSRARKRRPNSSIVSVSRSSACVVIEIGLAQPFGQPCQRFEHRFEIGQPAALGISERGLQPRFDGHVILLVRLTADPTYSGGEPLGAWGPLG